MKKTTLLLFLLVMAISLSAQRISSLTIDGKTSCVPFAAFNPTNNNASKPGDGQIIYPAGTDFSNVVVTLNYGTVATLDAPIPWPTDWTTTVTGIKINDAAASKWAMYDITLKAIKPGTLPLEIKTGEGNFSSDSWTTSTVGWAGACIDKTQNVVRFGSAGRSFMVAFDSAPDFLNYKINALGTWTSSGNIFDIDGSVDGVNWTSIKQYNAVNSMPASVTEGLKINNPSYRYIRWIYTTRNSGGGAFNVSLENILVTKLVSTFTGTGTNDNWSNAARWTFLPLETTEVVVASGELTIDQTPVIVSKVTINPGAKLTLSNTKTLNVTGSFTIESNADNGTGTFVDNNESGGLAVDGSKTVKQYLSSTETGINGRNWYISSPLSAALSSTITSATGNGLVYYDGSAWTDASSTMAIMKGYIAKSPAQNTTISFNGGTLNTGAQSLSNMALGFNLVGNPYASAVDWAQATKTV